MNCLVTAWTYPHALDPDARCPACGQDGFGHITKFVGDQMGRHCLECHAAWPITGPSRPTETVEASDA